MAMQTHISILGEQCSSTYSQLCNSRKQVCSSMGKRARSIEQDTKGVNLQCIKIWMVEISG